MFSLQYRPPAAGASALSSLRHRIAPPGADVRLVEILDIPTGLRMIAFVDVSSEPKHGDPVIITDGIDAFERQYRADVPVPDDLVLFGVNRAIVIPR